MKGLDRWLTKAPDNDFTDWCEIVVDNYEFEEDENFDMSKLEDKWLDKLYNKDMYSPEQCAKIITRAYKRYVKK